VEQKVGARLERREDLAMRQISACRIAGLVDEIEPEGRAFLERHRARLKGADAQLRPLHVGEHADRTSGLALDFADLDEAFSMLIVRAVAEVQPEYIDAGHEQSPDRVFGRARWPEGRDDFCVTATASVGAHLIPPLRPLRSARRGSRSRW